MPRKNRIHLGDQYHDVAYQLGDFVYLRVRDEPVMGQVVGYLIRPGSLLYCVGWPDGERDHYESELSTSAFVMETTENEDLEDEDDTANAKV